MYVCMLKFPSPLVSTYDDKFYTNKFVIKANFSNKQNITNGNNLQ